MVSQLNSLVSSYGQMLCTQGSYNMKTPTLGERWRQPLNFNL